MWNVWGRKKKSSASYHKPPARIFKEKFCIHLYQAAFIGALYLTVIFTLCWPDETMNAYQNFLVLNDIQITEMTFNRLVQSEKLIFKKKKVYTFLGTFSSIHTIYVKTILNELHKMYFSFWSTNIRLFCEAAFLFVKVWMNH